MVPQAWDGEWSIIYRTLECCCNLILFKWLWLLLFSYDFKTLTSFFKRNGKLTCRPYFWNVYSVVRTVCFYTRAETIKNHVQFNHQKGTYFKEGAMVYTNKTEHRDITIELSVLFLMHDHFCELVLLTYVKRLSNHIWINYGLFLFFFNEDNSQNSRHISFTTFSYRIWGKF